MFSCLGFLIAFFATLLFSPSITAQEKPKIFLGASSKTLGYSPLWDARRKASSNSKGWTCSWCCFAGCR